jgi:hypothetical protein
MAVEGNSKLQIPKTRTLRKLLDDERENITLLWVPAHIERLGNETVVEETKTALEDNLLQELINWIKTEALKIRNKNKEQGKRSQMD